MELSCSSDYLGDAKVIKFSFLSQFRGDEIIESPTFPEVKLTAQQVFQAGLTADEIAGDA